MHISDSQLLDKDLGHWVPPVVAGLLKVPDSVEAAVQVDVPLSRAVLDVAAARGATRAGNGRTELVVVLGAYSRVRFGTRRGMRSVA